MRCAGRNRRRVYYANVIGEKTAYDEYGNESGQELVYTAPTPLLANVSAARNADTAAVFGIDINYDKVLMVAGRDCPITETTVLWVDHEPTYDQAYDYVVSRVSESLNSTAVALRKVDVSIAR